MRNTEVVEKFVERINDHDTDGLVALMSADHVFIDSLGNRFARPAIETGWRQYFATVPDYWIKVDHVVADEPALILFGIAGGTYVENQGVIRPDNKWETHAVWRVIVRDEKVSEWRIYADNEPLRERMRKNSQQQRSASRGSKRDQIADTKTKLEKGETTEESVNWRALEEEATKKLDGFTRQMAEERYDYLSSRPISELTDAEYEERLALAERLSEIADKKKTKRKVE